MDKKEQEKLLTEIMEADAKDGLYKQQTAVEFLLENIHLLHSLKWNDVIEQAKQIEKNQLFDAMMHALDEDGHTGDWKVKFINNYIDRL